MSSSRPTFSVFMLVAALILGGAFLASPDSADAIEFQAGAAGKFGINTVYPKDTTVLGDPPLGWGGGAQIYALVRFIPFLGVGLNFDYGYFSHTDDTTKEYSFSMPSVGLIVRVLGIDPKKKAQTTAWGGSLWANYMFGSGIAETPNADGSVQTRKSDYNGAQIGINVLYQFRIQPYKTFIEVGPYLSYNFADFETESINAAGNNVTEEISTPSLQFGLSLQATFQFGM